MQVWKSLEVSSAAALPDEWPTSKLRLVELIWWRKHQNICGELAAQVAFTGQHGVVLGVPAAMGCRYSRWGVARGK